MGFLSGLFKKKKGGTMFGNLLRGVSSKVTGGLLGSGAGLQAWEESQNQTELNDLQKQLMVSNNRANNGFAAGQKMAMAGIEAAGGQPNATIGQSVFTETLKKNWYFVLGGVIAIVGIVYLIVKPKSNKKFK
jgi:hypothetical protein